MLAVGAESLNQLSAGRVPESNLVAARCNHPAVGRHRDTLNRAVAFDDRAQRPGADVPEMHSTAVGCGGKGLTVTVVDVEAAEAQLFTVVITV